MGLGAVGDDDLVVGGLAFGGLKDDKAGGGVSTGVGENLTEGGG